MGVTNHAIALRLERAEAEANIAFVEARAALAPDVGAAWRAIDGTLAMFDGVGSPVTQTFGLGLFEPFDAATIPNIEAFFFSRGAAVNHEVCEAASPDTAVALADHGYAPVEHSNVLQRSLLTSLPISPRRSGGPTTRFVTSAEYDSWSHVAARGWNESKEHESFLRDFGALSARTRGFRCFAAEIDGEMIATAGIAIHKRVGLLAGASTVAEYRGRGAQSALLAARLAYARGQGCDLALIVTAPDSTSQQNAARAGFSLEYGRTKYCKSAPAL
jgi:GNAT superfamily N-acetyltransferase